MPLKARVVDFDTGEPVVDATVLRIVCDVHDFLCSRAKLDRGKTDRNGSIEMAGERRWGAMVPAPGGIPLPNHRVAIWKKGYAAFVFSQYGSIEDVRLGKRADLIEAIGEIPKERRERTGQDDPERFFASGKIELHRIVTKSESECHNP
jgi:hypothetical protein